MCSPDNIITMYLNMYIGRGSGFSLRDGSLPSVNSPPGIGPLQHEPYLLRGLRDQPTLTRAPGQSGSQVQAQVDIHCIIQHISVMLESAHNVMCMHTDLRLGG